MNKLGEVFKISKGKKAIESSVETSLRYIQIGDLRNDDVMKYTTQSSNNVVCTKDDILIAWDGANAGTVGYNLEGVIGSTLAKLSPKRNGVHVAFVGRFLQSKFTYLRENCTGATIPHLSRTVLENIQIPLPPIEQQKKIAAILDAADEYRQKTKALIAKYDELTQSLFLDMFGDPVSNPKGWEKFSLKSVCNKITDGTHDTPKRLTQGIKFITGKHIKPFYIDFENSDYVTEEVHAEIYKRCNPEFGDILYTNIGVNYATAALNSVHYEFSMKNVALLKYKREILNGRYLECILNNVNFKDRLKNNFGIGGAQQFLSLANIKSIEVLLPPIKLQNQFAERVQAIEVQKAQAQASLDKAEELFNSLLQRAFNGELV